MARLPEIQMDIHQHQNPTREAYQQAYNLILAGVQEWPAQTGTLLWPMRISDVLIHLIEEGDLIACILLVYHGLALHLSSKKWFLKGAGQRLILGVLERLGPEIPPKWKDMVDWAREKVDV